MDALEGQESLDGIAGTVREAVRGLPLGQGRDVLRGLWLGHPLHPVLVQLPIGSWSSAAILDLFPGESRAARRLVTVGLVAAGPAALAGWVDWAEQRPRQARVGLVHAAANIAAVTAYAASLAARTKGRHALGRLLGFGGLTIATAGGVLGGHLAYRQAAGVNHAEAVPVLVEPGWHRVGKLDDFPVGEPVRRTADEVAVVVVRGEDGVLNALADRCSHMDGPLHEGKILEGCIECPWHGSRFRLSDGANIQGPATAPQPRFDCRVAPDGTVEVRLASP
ncbi:MULTISPECIES: Rieske (2Fe-2S) protein [unclassified Streptomyces]|uniref:Rieske (2Fe-2S) protein n=1 Tax=unclassified Streptomyces TaxID=2593676 RepID=UPI0011A00331|nr:Rieske (2Fe-2S) protein [Streptomyces sp. BK340]TVZ96168.1 nitrite reductase/ring-hydroxylating ferredoxin subunit [Streptomyces sp. BK340]